MNDGVELQSGHQQRGPELDTLPLQTETPSQTGGVQFETTFSKSMMIEPTFTQSPSTQPSYTEPSFFRPTFTEPTHTETPPPQALPTLNHVPWMNLSVQISFLGTHIEKLVVVSDTSFYSIKDHMDQYQVGFTSQFEYLQQMIDHIEDRLKRQHEEMMAYLYYVFPSPPHQPLFVGDPPCSFFMLPKGKIFQDLGGQI